MATATPTIRIIYLAGSTYIPEIINSLDGNLELIAADTPFNARNLATASSDLLLLPKSQMDFMHHAADALFILDPENNFHSIECSCIPNVEKVKESCHQLSLRLKSGDDIEDGKGRWIENKNKAWEVRLRKTKIKEKIYIFALLFDRSGFRRLQYRIDAIHAAGKSFGEIDSDSIKTLNMPSRLRLVEERIVRAIHELLDFDNFEVRLLNKKTNQLELIISENLPPLEIGEVIFANIEKNGITGHVAATGKSYICRDVSRDPLYSRAHDHSASSLTVPLFLGERVIGTLNAESFKKGAFDQTDQQLAEILGRHIAEAMHLLDLLLVERFTTNEQVSKTVLNDIRTPMSRLQSALESIQKQKMNSEASDQEINIAISALNSIKDRLINASKGPRTILDTEVQVGTIKGSNLLKKNHILVADDDFNIRNGAIKILEACGAHVTTAENGLETIRLIESCSSSNISFDIILSDIRMPKRNGYEIFRAVQEFIPETPIVLMTGFGYDPHHSVIRADQEGMSAVLYKPFRAQQLIEVLSSVIKS